MTKIGLFFGSFNPIHIGHLVIANHMVEFTDLEQVWLVVSPQNPFKERSQLLNDYIRLDMVRMAIEHYPKLRASDIEFSLPKPSYTIDTLTYLQEKYPEKEFSLIMGMDNLESFPKWKNHEQILKNHHLYVYPRIGSEGGELVNHPNVTIVPDVPVMQISATFIRESIRNNKNVTPLLPEKVADFLDKNIYYRK